MSDTNIPLFNGILPLAILVLIHYFLTLLTRKNKKIRQFMCGKPIIIISPEGIEYQAMKDLNMSVDDLIEMLRQTGYYFFDQVQYAIIETNGKMSVIPTSENAPATAKDVSAKNPPAQLPHIIVSDGKTIKGELKNLKLSQKSFNNIINKLNAHNIKDILILSVDESGKIYYQIKNEQYKIIENYNWEEKE